MSSAKPIHIGPDMRVHHPDYGDMTEDVARELALLREERHRETMAEAQRNQMAIARQGRESRISKHGGMRLVAQVDESVFNYWEAREGRDFWKHELGYMTKRHPEIAVTPKFDHPTIRVPAMPFAQPVAPARTGVHGKRGRWAT